MSIKCPICHSHNPETKQFCGDCGTPLTPAADVDLSFTETLEAPKEKLNTGTTFAGRYQIIEELGRGGMGKVYKAQDMEIKEKIALKLIKPEISSDKKTIERFQNELKLARKISHRNVCRMYDLGKSEGDYFITMEYVHGEDLKGMIRMMGQLSAGKAISIAKQVCEGLSEAHRIGIIHRDLKPGNIMIDKEGNAKIMDFGIARSLRGKDITAEGVMIGTPEYISPEQVESKEVDQRSDIYSLGVILYEMVTGRVPFEGETPLSVVMKHKKDVPPNPTNFNAQVSEDLSRVILKCLEKDKSSRYPTAEELHAELARIEKEIPVRERTIPGRKTPQSREVSVRRGGINWKKMVFYGGVSVLLALTAYVVLNLFNSRKESIDSIAVLPFENVNADPNIDYLCDGITETIINKLSQLPNLKNICRNSVFTYKGKSVDPKKVGRELGVEAILLTRLARVGDRLVVSPTLVRTKDNSQLWGERYDQKFEDIFSIEEKIATAIVQVLRLKLTEEDRQKISERPIDNVAAYESYLRANQQIWRFREDALDRTIQELQNGLDIIGDNPLLLSAMAFAYFQYVNIGVKQEDYTARAEECAKKALAIDPNFSKAHTVLGLIYSAWGDRKNGMLHFKKALEANPNEADALRWLVLSYYHAGKSSAALQLIERYKEVDPLSPDNYLLQGISYFYEGQYALALDPWRKWYQSDPENPIKEYLYALVLAYNDALDESFSIIDQSARATPNNALTKLGILLKYGLLKDKERAFQVMTPDFQQTCKRDYEWSYYVAGTLALMDEKEEALDWLENSVNKGLINYPLVAERDPFLANIRGEERFKRLMERIKYEWEHFEE